MFRNTLLSLMFTALAAVVGASPPVVQASEQDRHQTVVLDVGNMTCSLCPITVRKALEKVPGVLEAKVGYEGDGVGWAKVVFDPATTDVMALVAATTNAGYPSTVRHE